MKVKILGILIILSFLGLGSEHTFSSKGFECRISTSKKEYKIGETPEVNVSIINNSGKDVYLIGSLDASEEKWRNPHSYYKIDKPNNDRLPIVGRCGNMNSLRKRDFKLVKSGESFNPYESNDYNSFFNSYQIQRKENFQTPGKYKITFYYSTKSRNIRDYLGDGKESSKLKELFDKVPNIELKSNTIEIEIVK